MNVIVDTAKNFISIKSITIIIISSFPVVHGINLGPGVHNVEVATARVGLQYTLDIVLILFRPSLEP